MNIIYDLGKAYNRLAMYNGSKRIWCIHTKDLSCEQIMEKALPFRLQKMIIHSSKELPEYIYDLISVDIPFVHLFSHKSKLPFTSHYFTAGTPDTGRIAAIAGACSHFPEQEILLISAGTVLTFDFLAAGKHEGTNISPGMSMRFKALQKHTGKRNFDSEPGEYTSPGKNDAEAVKAGVITGIVYEINEYIRTFKKEHKKAAFVISGPDADLLGKRIRYSTRYMPELVMDGLNYILEYNAK